MATKNSGLWTLSFGEIVETLKSLERNGVTPDHLARLRSHEAFAKSVGAFIVNGGSEVAPAPVAPTQKEFALQVNYDRKIEDCVKDGKYDRSNSDITSENFPTTRKGTADITPQLVHFNQNISSEDVIAKLDKLGLRPAETHELLALGAANPELQRQFSIIALGSVWRDPRGSRCVPGLYRFDSKRGLDLVLFDTMYGGRCRFAAVPK